MLALLDEEGGAVAIGLWTVCFTWAHRNTRKKGRTPGLLPKGLPRRMIGGEGQAAAELLVRVGLWEVAEDGGWQFHDFTDYLPSDKTRAARAEAGRKGAEARWGKKPPRGTDGNEPSQSQSASQPASQPGSHPSGHAGSHRGDGNEPSASHEDAGKPEAHDGSHAHGHWGPTPAPSPSPTPPSSPSPPPRSSSPQGAPAEAGGEGRQESSEGLARRHEAAQVIQMGLVAEIQNLRPEWSAASIRRALEHPDVTERPADLVRIAFVLVASDPETQHPGRLAADGPWWHLAARRQRPSPARPEWCGACESDSHRMVEVADGRVRRCPVCHPLEVRTA
ncbi:hypothetical protein [Actinomadura rudentiformis]|uniref:Uncharacterized protein n=1 Tax=Actinomadura rudentiformis TaxID=359158 RepID=A0A6H9YFM6_9ACTN|nr:hypothetical protein [Actinomadura rudentiformis]KAB2344830.1 hypothetical protein F8566_30020 [Actinomadura rudentiformis]